MQSAFPSHPYFPENLVLDKSFSNTITVRGTTTWMAVGMQQFATPRVAFFTPLGPQHSSQNGPLSFQ